MARELSEEQQEVLDEMAPLREEALALQKAYEDHRRRMRAQALRAHQHYGLPVLRIANNLGIDRRTVSVWIEVAAAENKSKK